MPGRFILVRETDAIKLHECTSVLKSVVSSSVTFTLVCSFDPFVQKNCVWSRNVPRCFFIPQYRVGSSRGDGFNRAYVT